MDQELRIELITTKIGLITHINDDRSLLSGLAMVQSAGKDNVKLFTYLENMADSQLEGLSNVIFTMQDLQQQMFISLSGIAHVEEDQGLVDKLWNENNENWFEAKKTDQSVFLINLEVKQAFFRKPE